MKKIIILSFLLLFCVSTVFAKESEDFKYVVTYKWGLIQKDAGDVHITKRPKGNGYELKMIAQTKPWADRVYKVRDTLISITSGEKYRPHEYIYISHEKNKYRRDNIKFTYSGNRVTGASEKYKEEKNGTITHSNSELSATGNVYDMLSVYFFLRGLDYPNLREGEVVRATIFSGSKEENLDVRFIGKETVELRDKTQHDAWHIVFKFTQAGGKKSSDDIDCWISTDDSHVPLLIVGSLPIGQIRVHYVGS